ncbi:four helix bundle protein [Hydrococcus rivularis]|uniref:four helix bundle protein n=1 Tax=Hydrococcus rivularis TaxID=1616834 RepID=UPI0009FA4F96|nr:four helix bundle protein [Hydrococcus rivularis]
MRRDEDAHKRERSDMRMRGGNTKAWRKRRYPAAFVSKLNDLENEASETQTWIEIALRCGYLTEETALELDSRCEEVLSQLVIMASHPEKWAINSPHHRVSSSRISPND